ncbi:MAG: class I SAM-dependent methyltransferase [Jatrophihabitans sp.]|uniref:class I SAM-dependent methyltransferase n=1 Tax=Jatrophihabitans sp. TaxID=1932789 RepID=UPI003F7D93F7
MQWRPEDTEPVVCCVCGLQGTPRWELDPFGIVQCERCGLVFVSPRLRPDALGRLYGDPAYHGGMYDGSRGAMALQRTWMAGRLDVARRALGRDVAGARLLEIGAGRGMFLAAAREQGFDVIGVELSEDAAAHARSTYGVTVHSTQLEDAPLDGRFDVVCAWDTVEHVPDPVDFWRTVASLLAPGGVVLFSTPYFSSLPARLLRTRWWTLKPAEHIWQFTPRTHRTVAAAGGLQVTRVVRSPLRRANFARLDSLVGVARAA